MSELHKAVRSESLQHSLAQQQKKSGYFHSTHRVMAMDAMSAISASRPDRACGSVKLQCVSVDLLAEDITILISPDVLTEDYETRGFYSDADWRKILKTTESEQFNAREGTSSGSREHNG